MPITQVDSAPPDVAKASGKTEEVGSAPHDVLAALGRLPLKEAAPLARALPRFAESVTPSGFIPHLLGQGGIDYSRGLPFGALVDFYGADSDAGRKLALDRHFGKGAAIELPDGEWVVSPTSLGLPATAQPVAVSGGSSFKRKMASVLAHAPELVGAVAMPDVFPAFDLADTAYVTKYLPFIKEGFGNLFRQATAQGAGAMLGKIAEDAVRKARGLSSATAPQEAGRLSKTFLGNAAPALVVGAPAETVLRGVRRGYSAFIPPEVRAMTAESLGRGLVPHVEQAAPTSKLLPFEQRMTHFIFGDMVNEHNEPILLNEMRSMLVKGGVPEADADHVLNALRKRDIPNGVLTDALQGRTRVEREAIAQRFAKETASAKQMLDEHLALLDRRARVPGVTAEAVAGDIRAAKEAFDAQSDALYARADAIVGDKKVVPLSGLKAEAKRVLAAMPRANSDAALFPNEIAEKTLANLADAPQYVSLATAARIRSNLRKFAESQTMTPGISEHEFGKLAKAADDAIDHAVISPKAPVAVKAWRAANEFYRNGVGKFSDLTANALVKEAGQRGAVEPEAVVGRIMKPGRIALAERIKKMVTPRTWALVGRDYWQTLMGSGRTWAEGPAQVDPKVFYANVQKAGGMLDLAFGPRDAALVREFAKRRLAFSGAMDTHLLAEGGPLGFRATLERALAVAKEHDDLEARDFVRNLTSDTADADEAISYMLKNPKRAQIARSFYGASSPEWKQIQAHVMTRILENSVGEGQDPLTTIISGSAFSDAVHRYGRETLDQVFGTKTTDDIFAFARVTKFLTAKGAQGHTTTGAFAAAYIVLNPLGHLGALVNFGLMGHLMATPGFIRWLALGARGDNAAYYYAARVVRTAVASFGVMGGEWLRSEHEGLYPKSNGAR